MMTHTLARIHISGPPGRTTHTGTCTCGATATLHGATSATDWIDRHTIDAAGAS